MLAFLIRALTFISLKSPDMRFVEDASKAYVLDIEGYTCTVRCKRTCVPFDTVTTDIPSLKAVYSRENSPNASVNATAVVGVRIVGVGVGFEVIGARVSFVGTGVGASITFDVGAAVAFDVGAAVAFDVGTAVAFDVGAAVAFDVGVALAFDVGDAVAFDVGDAVAFDVCSKVAFGVGASGSVNISARIVEPATRIITA